MTYALTKEEEAKVQQLKSRLDDHLKANNAINPKVCTEQKAIAINDEFLFKYIRGRKLNVTRAFDTILKYAEVKFVIFPEFFPNQVPNYVKSSIESKFLRLLSKKDNLGRTYLLVDTAKYDDSIISGEECGNVLRYAVEALMNSPDFLDNGVVILLDAAGVLLRHGKVAGSLTKFAMTFWRAFPVKLKEVLYFNAPMYAKSFLAIARPFIKSKAVDRVSVSSGLTTLHKHVPLDVLPNLYGGTLLDEVAYVPTEKLLSMVFGKQ